MKKIFYITTLVLLIVTSGTVLAQNNHLTVGFVSSHFHNYDSNDRLSQQNNPFGYGIVLGYQVNEQFALGFTGEYSKGDIQNVAGREKNFRGNFSFFVFPVSFSMFKPYVSAGIVYNHKNLDYDQLDKETDNWLNMRNSIGIDLAILPGIALNLDAAIYSDGLNFLGHANTVGLRYSF